MPDEYRLQRFRGGWAVSVYRDGQRVSRRRLQAQDEVGALREIDGLIAADRKPQAPTVRWIWEEYRTETSGRPVAETMLHTGKAVLPHFGALRPEEINKTVCDQYIARRKAAGRADGAIWTELGHLRTALQWAEKRRLIERAPAIDRPRKPDPKTRYLTRHEFSLLLANTDAPHARLFLILAISTAGRKEAILGLKWDRIDFQRGQVSLADPLAERRLKGRATVPMSNTLRAALSAARPYARSEYVVEWAGERVGSVRTSLAKASKGAGLSPAVTPHVLRHTAAVWMAESGVPMSKIAQYLGHSDDRITQRVYARYSPAFLRDAADALELEIYEVNGGSSEPKPVGAVSGNDTRRRT